MINTDKDEVRLGGRRLIGGGFALALILATAGCAGGPSCLKAQRYESAKVFPKLKDPAGLTVPQADPDMKIPSVANGPIAAYSTAPKGTESSNPQSRCLTTPPPLEASN